MLYKEGRQQTMQTKIYDLREGLANLTQVMQTVTSEAETHQRHQKRSRQPLTLNIPSRTNRNEEPLR